MNLFIKETGKNYSKLIVFLHGVGSSNQMWSKHLKAFSDYHCIAPDLPGHGNSNQVLWTNLDDVADQIYQLIVDSNHKKAYLVGLSLGGSLIINMLSKYPKIIDRAVVDGAGIFPIKGKDLIKIGVSIISPFLRYKVINNGIAGSLGIASKQELLQFQTDMEAVSPFAFRTAFSQANDQTEPNNLDGLNIPVLFMAGEKEASETKASNKHLAKIIGKSKAVAIPNVGHGWVAKNPELHIEMIKKWFS